MLCQTLAGNNCEMLIITDFQATDEKLAEREAIILSARVHPGETPASFVMEGVIDFLLSNDAKAKQLRSSFVFKIVPMLNADGVINGNSRCNLIGLDMNRQWRFAEGAAPEIEALREQVVKT